MNRYRRDRRDFRRSPPRVCGDGPGLFSGGISMKPNPHAGGDRPRPEVTRDPARAGIDHAVCEAKDPQPRTRGDRPVRTGGHLVQRNPARAGIDHPTERAARALSRSPPRTAGSGGNVGLYPVCAGTNRGRTCSRRCCRTLPPRARGWTVLPHRTAPAAASYPARAGIDHPPAQAKARRYPTPRGSTTGRHQGKRGHRSPPRARGSTERRSTECSATPARAGIDIHPAISTPHRNHRGTH